MSHNVVAMFIFNPKFGQLLNEYDDFTFSSLPIKTPKIFSVNNSDNYLGLAVCYSAKLVLDKPRYHAQPHSVIVYYIKHSAL